MSEAYAAKTHRSNMLAHVAGKFPHRKKGAEHVHLLTTMRSMHAALTRYEDQRAEGVALYGSYVEVFAQTGERLVELLAATADATE